MLRLFSLYFLKHFILFLYIYLEVIVVIRPRNAGKNCGRNSDMSSYFLLGHGNWTPVRPIIDESAGSPTAVTNENSRMKKTAGKNYLNIQAVRKLYIYNQSLIHVCTLSFSFSLFLYIYVYICVYEVLSFHTFPIWKTYMLFRDRAKN